MLFTVGRKTEVTPQLILEQQSLHPGLCSSSPPSVETLVFTSAPPKRSTPAAWLPIQEQKHYWTYNVSLSVSLTPAKVK